MNDSRKILITGTNSFIGTYFAKHANFNYTISEACVKDTPIYSIDFSDCDTVFHVAAIVHQSSKLDESVYYLVNSDLAYDIARKCKSQGVKQFVFMSTVKVYGENSTEDNPWTEFSECHPTDAYGKSKLDAEQRIKTLADDDFIVSIIRTPVVYGANVKGNIKKMAQYIKITRLIPLGGIDNIRAMVYIGNLMAMIYRIIDLRRGGVFLAGDRKVVSTSEFVKLLIDACDEKKVFISIPKFVLYFFKLLLPKIYRRLYGSMVINNDWSKKELDFNPPYLMKQGAEEVIDSIPINTLRNRLVSL